MAAGTAAGANILGFPKEKQIDTPGYYSQYNQTYNCNYYFLYHNFSVFIL